MLREARAPDIAPTPAIPPPGPICQVPLEWGRPDCPEVPSCPPCPKRPALEADGPSVLEQEAGRLEMSLLMFEEGGAWWSDLKPGQTIGVQHRGDGIDHERLLLHPCTKEEDVWYFDEHPEAVAVGSDADVIMTYPLPDVGSKPDWLTRKLYRFRVCPDRSELAAMIKRGYRAAVKYDTGGSPPALEDVLPPTGDEIAIGELIPGWPRSARRVRGKQREAAGAGGAGPPSPPPAEEPPAARADSAELLPGLRWYAMGYSSTLSPGDAAALDGQTFVRAGASDAPLLGGAKYAHCLATKPEAVPDVVAMERRRWQPCE
ncbi:unnamed protein product, partial [Prorocentrum cordatum]